MKISKKTYFLMAMLSSLLVGVPTVGKCADGLSVQTLKTKMKAAELETEADFNKALAAAKKEGKVLMLEFSGNDWCPPCKMLKKFVVDTEEFAKYAKEKLHVVVADFSSMGEPTNKTHAKTYRELADKYQITGFPTIVLIDPASDTVETIVGLQVQSPKELAARIDSFKARAAKK